MKLQLVLLSALLAGAQAQSTPLQHFNNICPARNGEQEEITPGYTVKYICGFRGKFGGPIRDNIFSPADCAVACKDDSDCVASTWVPASKKCLLGNEAEPDSTYSGGLFMQWIQEDPLAPTIPDPLAPGDDCETLLADCENKLGELTQQASILPAEELSSPINCNAGASADEFVDDQKTILSGGKYWTILCRNAGFGDVGSAPGTDLKHCISQCAVRDNCIQTTYGPEGCRFSAKRHRNAVGTGGIVKYHTAVLFSKK